MERPDPQDLPARIRLSDADREAVVSDLRVAMGEGRLSLHEFEERSAVVYRARFEHELNEVRSDLPVPATPPAPGHRTPAGRVDTADTGGRVRRWLITVMGGREWKGRWGPGRRNIVISVMGGQTIDLTDLDIDDIDILAITIMGGTDIIVPRGAEVDHGGFMLMGGQSADLDPAADPPDMRVRVRAWGMMGGVDVHHPPF